MATEVELPQLGESVTEGIITAWLVEVGDEVSVDQPLVEISTDKVDTEIPSPAAGVVSELRAEVDETIEVGQIIAVIDGDAAATASSGGDQGASDADEGADEGSSDSADDAGGAAADDGQRARGSAESGTSTGAAAATTAEDTTTGAQDAGRQATSTATGDQGPILTSPLVRRLLREAGLSADQVTPTGPGGRITRDDADRAIAAGGEGGGGDASEAPSTAEVAATPSVTPPPAVPEASGQRKRPDPAPNQIDFGGQRAVTEPLSRVRKAIAGSMIESLQTTAQLTAAVEVDLTAIMNLRAAKKDEFKAKEGASLSPLPIISRAVCMVLPRHPVLNSSMNGDEGTVTYHSYVNLGMAVDTERGLLVPNIKDAQDLTVPALARRIADLASRTRNKKIQPDEISGGTFTVTNTGSVGTLFDTPILNPPEVAILATCVVEKRPVVVSDAYGDSIAIRWMSYLCLSYDHRMVDGADAARFLQDLKYVLETHDFTAELGV